MWKGLTVSGCLTAMCIWTEVLVGAPASALPVDETPTNPAASTAATSTEPARALANPARAGIVAAIPESPQGSIGRLRLVDGLEVQFPSSWGSAISAVTGTGQDVVLTGVVRKTPAGKEIMELASLTNPTSGVVIHIRAPMPQPAPVSDASTPSVEAKPKAEKSELRGRVTEFRSSNDGRTDQLVVDGRNIVRFPPALGDQLMARVRTGTEVLVAGVTQTGPMGDSVLRAETVRVITTGELINLSKSGGRNPEGGGAEKNPKPAHERILKEFRSLPKSFLQQFGAGKPPKNPSADKLAFGEGKPPKENKKNKPARGSKSEGRD